MVGFFNLGLQSEFLTNLALFSSAYHVPFCIFSDASLLKMLDGENSDVIIWNGVEFVESVSPLPDLIDSASKLGGKNSRLFFGNEAIDRLFASSHVLSQKSLNKYVLLKALLHNDLSLYAIPTVEVNDFQSVINQLQIFPRAVIKPSNGRQGIGVCKIERDNNQLIVNTVNGKSLFNEAFFHSYLLDMQKENMSSFLLQPCLDFRLDDNHSVDFRLLRHRGRHGEWEEVATYARIGATNIVSNLHQGGYIGNAREILKCIAGDKADSLYEEIMMLGVRVPRIIQRYRGENAFCLGMDVAIDRETMRPFVLEANTFPGTQYHKAQLAQKRVLFYQYVLENRL